ncbi:MAG: type II toxin-antitoxin system RelE/ParE family toxin [Gemmatimonadaceae bacterium]
MRSAARSLISSSTSPEHAAAEHAPPSGDNPFPQCWRRAPGHRRDAASDRAEGAAKGEMPDDWKPMSTVGAGTMEIRLHVGTEYRVFVVAKFDEAIYVLHAFEKKSQKTPQRDIDLAKRRYQDLVAERRRK